MKTIIYVFIKESFIIQDVGKIIYDETQPEIKEIMAHFSQEFDFKFFKRYYC